MPDYLMPGDFQVAAVILYDQTFSFNWLSKDDCIFPTQVHPLKEFSLILGHIKK
jgi:hypothetical protein